LLGLNTSTGRKDTMFVLKKYGLLKYFKAIVCFEDCKARKPSPNSYILTAKKLGAKPSECIAIEDTKHGVQAAESAGITCFLLHTKFNKELNYKNTLNKKELLTKINLFLKNTSQ